MLFSETVDEYDDRRPLRSRPSARAIGHRRIKSVGGTEAQRRDDVREHGTRIVRGSQELSVGMGLASTLYRVLAHQRRDRSRAWKTAARSFPAKSAIRSTAACPSASAETRSMTSSAKIDPP